ncbi:uncharacterized protein METZ01_LOCUS303458, partial [marine metagenome]
VWAIQGSNASMGYSTHAAFRFFGKFPPPVARRFIKELHHPSLGPVVDTMVGSGTTLVESSILGRKAIGLDINPLSVLISNVKVTKLERDQVEQTIDEYERHMSKGASTTGDISDYIPKDRYMDHWFFPAVQKQLAQTRLFIENIGPADVKNLFTASLAASIRSCSRASNNLGRMFLDPAIEPVDVCPIIVNRVRKILVGLEEIPDEKYSEARLHNSMEPLADDLSSNLVICHPPYFNVYKFSSIFKFEMLWTGFNPKEVRIDEVRESFKIGKPERVDLYVEDLLKSVRNTAPTLVKGGWLILMMGDTTIHEERINTTSLILRGLQSADYGLTLDKFIIRVPKHTEASYAAAQRRDGDQVGVKLFDHILVLRKR